MSLSFEFGPSRGCQIGQHDAQHQTDDGDHRHHFNECKALLRGTALVSQELGSLEFLGFPVPDVSISTFAAGGLIGSLRPDVKRVSVS